VVAPSIQDFYFTPGRALALGAESVKAQLEKSGVYTELFNFPLLNPRGKQIAPVTGLDHLKPYIISGERGPLSFFSGYKRFGPAHSDSARMILSTDPQVIFISLFAWAYGENAIKLAEEIRKLKGGDIPIILGGPGAAVLPDYFRKTGLFQFISTGDAEDVIVPILKILNEKSENFSAVPTGFNAKQPSPALSFRIDNKGSQWLSMTVSRGCPLLCQFCSNFLTQGRKLRTTSVDILKTELENLSIDRSKNIHITLEDDNLLVRKSYFNELLEMIKTILPLSTFSIDNGLDYTNMTTEYADYLLSMGFNRFTFSLGSSDLKTLKEEKRPGNFRKLEEILNHLQKRDIPVSTFLICGLPEDTPSTIIDSLIYLHRLPTDIGISLFYPVPGIPRFEDKEIFSGKPPSLCCGSSAYPWGQSLTTEEMITAFRLARLSNLINKRDKSAVETELTGMILSERKLYTIQGKSKRIIKVRNLNEPMEKDFLKTV